MPSFSSQFQTWKTNFGWRHCICFVSFACVGAEAPTPAKCLQTVGCGNKLLQITNSVGVATNFNFDLLRLNFCCPLTPYPLFSSCPLLIVIVFRGITRDYTNSLIAYANFTKEQLPVKLPTCCFLALPPAVNLQWRGYSHIASGGKFAW